MDYKLTELIEQKAFEDLSEVERSFVLNHLSEEEYRERYQLLSEVKSELKSEGKELKSGEHIRANVLEALRSKQQKKESRVLPMLFNYKVPLWTSVAAIFLVFILTTPFILNTDLEKVRSSKQLTMRDTVYVEKIVRDTVEVIQPADTVIKTIYALEKNTSTVNVDRETPVFSNEKKSMSQKELELVLAYEDYANPIELDKRSSGKSLSEDPIGQVVIGVSD
ncbi:MAG: hypothetical protein WED10_11295 [Brumimicrobium sp.]